MKPIGDFKKLERYVETIRMPLELSDRYELDPKDLIAIVREVKGNAYAAAMLAFTYGKAKGYRTGKKSMEAQS